MVYVEQYQYTFPLKMKVYPEDHFTFQYWVPRFILDWVSLSRSLLCREQRDIQMDIRYSNIKNQSDQLQVGYSIFNIKCLSDDLTDGCSILECQTSI